MRAELEGHWPADAPDGTCVITSLEGGGIRIDHADPRVVISAELLDMVARGAASPEATFTWPAACPVCPDRCPDPQSGATSHKIGGVVRINAVNRRVIYRITEYLAAIHGYIAEWPD